MYGHLHRLARFARLALACVAVATGGLPAQAASAAETPVAVSVLERAAATVVTTRRPGASQRRSVPHLYVGRPSRAHRPRAPLGSGPPRSSGRLFIAHRALLR